MGNVSYESHLVHLTASQQDAYEFLSKMDHFGHMLPEQVSNWEASGERCSFDITGMAHIELIAGENKEPGEVNIISAPGSSPELALRFSISPSSGNGCGVSIRLSANLSPMLQMLAANPLQNLVNIMADRLKEHFES